MRTIVMRGLIQVICLALLGCYPPGSVEKTAKPVSGNSTGNGVPAWPPADSEAVTFECFYPVETMPEFPGGRERLASFLAATLRMPREAKRKKVTGTVFVSFTITPAGAVQEAKVLKGIGHGCDEEALRVVKMMPNWKPGEQSGIPIPVRYSLPIRFLGK
ncbi:MAG: energy transducer TonB [Cytophagales bacterium]|nr:energy transducer TonB [Cytophagales bacterium]